MSAAGIAYSDDDWLFEEEKHLVPAIEPRSLRILLIEDCADYVDLVVNALKNQSLCEFEVERVARLEVGVEKLSQVKYDAVLLDLGLPDADAETTIGLVCSQATEIPVLVLTASEDTRLALLAGQAGAEEFILKDRLNRRTLAATIIDAVARHRSHHLPEVVFEVGLMPEGLASMLEH